MKYLSYEKAGSCKTGVVCGFDSETDSVTVSLSTFTFILKYKRKDNLEINSKTA